MLNPGRLSSCLLSFAALAAILPVASATEVNWSTDVEAAIEDSRATGRLVLMKFTADWCGYCKKMETTTFAEPTMVEFVNRDFVPVLVDFDRHRELAAHLKISGLPALLVVAPDLTIVERISGYHTAAKLTPKLQTVLASWQPSEGPPARTASQSRMAPVPEPAPGKAPVDWSDAFGDVPATRNETSPDPFAEVDPYEQPNPFADADDVAGYAKLDPVSTDPEPAFGGLCLTSVVDKRELIRGIPQYSLTYRGQLLHFHDADQRAAFRASPKKYWPKLDGSCVMTLLESGRHVPGQLENAAVFRGRIWLFASREKMQSFIQAPADIVARLEARGELR